MSIGITMQGNFTIGDKIATVHKLFWDNSSWVTVTQVAAPVINEYYSYSARWNSQRAQLSP